MLEMKLDMEVLAGKTIGKIGNLTNLELQKESMLEMK